MTAEKKTSRTYTRRSDEQRIADLERRIAELKTKAARQGKREDPVLREIPKLQRRLQKFAQLAMDGQRPDLSNSAMAFHASLARTLQGELKPASYAAEDDTDTPPKARPR